LCGAQQRGRRVESGIALVKRSTDYRKGNGVDRLSWLHFSLVLFDGDVQYGARVLPLPRDTQLVGTLDPF
jgi:hypothetical protein